MVSFDSGHSLNWTSLCLNAYGCQVYACDILIGQEAFTAGTHTSLGKRTR